MPLSALSPAAPRTVSMCPHHDQCSRGGGEPLSHDPALTRSTTTTGTTTCPKPSPLHAHSPILPSNHRSSSTACEPHALRPLIRFRKDLMLAGKTGKERRSLSPAGPCDINALDFSDSKRVDDPQKLNLQQPLVDVANTKTGSHVCCKGIRSGLLKCTENLEPVLKSSQSDSSHRARSTSRSIFECQVPQPSLRSPSLLTTCSCGQSGKTISSLDSAQFSEVISKSWIHLSRNYCRQSWSGKQRSVRKSPLLSLHLSDTVEDIALRNLGEATDVTISAESHTGDVINSRATHSTHFVNETVKSSCESNRDTERIVMEHLLPTQISTTCRVCSEERTKPMTCQQPESKPSTWRSRPSLRSYGSYFTQVIAAVSALLFLISPTVATMDIWAFEYQRQFGQELKLGQCPMREVLHQLGNETVNVRYKCDLTYPGTVRNVEQPQKNVRNVMITSPENITAFLGLCGGEAASFLGILNSGDCAGLQIASKLSFSPRTLVRAYISYYRKSIDVLDRGRDISIKRMQERESGLDDKYYLQSIAYGTQEIIFVQFRFMTTEEAKKAKGIQLKSVKMTDYMKRIRSSVGTPKVVTVISMSTSDPKSYKEERFETLRSTAETWNRTYRHVDIQERYMDYRNERIEKDIVKPHLKYQFSPFLEEKTVGFRTKKGNPKDWEQVSMIEVRLQRDIELAKKSSRNCRKITRGPYKDLCRRVRHHRKRLVSLKKDIHAERAKWAELEPAKKNEIINMYRIRVAPKSRYTKKLAKDVRIMRRELKRKWLLEKSKQRNQIPVSLPARSRPIRHQRHWGTVGRKGRNGIMSNTVSKSTIGRKDRNGSMTNKVSKGRKGLRGQERRRVMQWKNRSKRKHLKKSDKKKDPNLRYQRRHRRRRIRPRPRRKQRKNYRLQKSLE